MGAGGIEIAELLADRLTDRSNGVWMVFDRNLAELVWKNQNLPDPVDRFLEQEIPKPSTMLFKNYWVSGRRART